MTTTHETLCISIRFFLRCVARCVAGGLAMAKDITPEHLRCSLGGCPSVHVLDDGRLAIVADLAGEADKVPEEIWAKRDFDAGEALVVIRQDYFIDLPLVTRLRSENERLREALGCQANAEQGEAAHRATRSSNDRCGDALVEALQPFVQHGRAVGAFGGDRGPFRMYTCDGYRSIPAEDFWRALAALKEAVSQRPDEERSVSEAMSAISEPDASLTPIEPPRTAEETSAATSASQRLPAASEATTQV